MKISSLIVAVFSFIGMYIALIITTIIIDPSNDVELVLYAICILTSVIITCTYIITTKINDLKQHINSDNNDKIS